MAESFVLGAIALEFAKRVAVCTYDITGEDAKVDELRRKNNEFRYENRLTAMIGFVGSVSGYFLLSTLSNTARLLVRESLVSPNDEIHKDFVCELLNTAVGQSIADLQKHFSHLTWFPPMSIQGDLELPRFVSCAYSVLCSKGEMICSIVLNLADLSIAQALSEMALRAGTDALTGLHNRSYLKEYVDRKILSQGKQPLNDSLIMVDVDDFKSVNDTYGHPLGDEILVLIGKSLLSCCKKGESIRYGGDEFIVILPQTEKDEAFAIAERIQDRFASLMCPLKDRYGQQFRVTLSMAVHSTADSTSVSESLARLDEFLYKAKSEGKNRIAGP